MEICKRTTSEEQQQLSGVSRAWKAGHLVPCLLKEGNLSSCSKQLSARESKLFQREGIMFSMWPVCTLPATQRTWSLPRRLQPGSFTRDQKSCKMGAIQKAEKQAHLQTPQKDLPMVWSPARSPTKKVSRTASPAAYGKSDFLFKRCYALSTSCGLELKQY